MRSLPLILLLAACSTIDTNSPPPVAWPKLDVTVRKVPQYVFDAQCGKSGLLMHVNACAGVDLLSRECVIFVRDGDTMTPEVEQHERMHCAGYDHPGESTMRDAWAKFSSPRPR